MQAADRDRFLGCFELITSTYVFFLAFFFAFCEDAAS
jgi:hypothetical protein